MIQTYNVDYFYPFDLLHQLSLTADKPVLYLNAIGPSACTEERKNEIWEFYYDKCDNTVISGLRQEGEMYCYFLSMEQAFRCFNEWFPQKRDLTEEEMDFYVYARLIYAKDNIDIVNGNEEI